MAPQLTHNDTPLPAIFNVVDIVSMHRQHNNWAFHSIFCFCFTNANQQLNWNDMRIFSTLLLTRLSLSNCLIWLLRFREQFVHSSYCRISVEYYQLHRKTMWLWFADRLNRFLDQIARDTQFSRRSCSAKPPERFFTAFKREVLRHSCLFISQPPTLFHIAILSRR